MEKRASLPSFQEKEKVGSLYRASQKVVLFVVEFEQVDSPVTGDFLGGPQLFRSFCWVRCNDVN